MCTEYVLLFPLECERAAVGSEAHSSRFRVLFASVRVLLQITRLWLRLDLLLCAGVVQVGKDGAQA